MASTVKTFRNNSINLDNQLAAIDANGIKNENNNLISRSELVLDENDHSQTSRAAAYMSIRSPSYVSSFNLGVIELEPYSGTGGDLLPVSQYFNGQIIFFKSPIISDGITPIFVKIGFLSTKPFTLAAGSIIPAGMISAAVWVSAVYREKEDRFELRINDNVSLAKIFPSNPTIIAPTFKGDILFDQFDLNLDGYQLIDGKLKVPTPGIYDIIFQFNSSTINPVGFNTTGSYSLNIELNLFKNDVIFNKTIQSYALTTQPLQTPVTAAWSETVYLDFQTQISIEPSDEVRIEIGNIISESDLTIFGGKSNTHLNIRLVELR